MNNRAYARKLLRASYKFHSNQITIQKAQHVIFNCICNREDNKDNNEDPDTIFWLIKYLLQTEPIIGTTVDAQDHYTQLLIDANLPKNYKEELS